MKVQAQKTKFQKYIHLQSYTRLKKSRKRKGKRNRDREIQLTKYGKRTTINGCKPTRDCTKQGSYTGKRQQRIACVLCIKMRIYDQGKASVLHLCVLLRIETQDSGHGRLEDSQLSIKQNRVMMTMAPIPIMCMLDTSVMGPLIGKHLPQEQSPSTSPIPHIMSRTLQMLISNSSSSITSVPSTLAIQAVLKGLFVAF